MRGDKVTSAHQKCAEQNIFEFRPVRCVLVPSPWGDHLTQSCQSRVSPTGQELWGSSAFTQSLWLLLRPRVCAV